ncbi:MAG: hypothetical protein JWR55_3153 [Aeromicrobium sp.]|jgi:hypothetical protein|nr:hypothetical protein [Aeromicrobium sp.]
MTLARHVAATARHLRVLTLVLAAAVLIVVVALDAFDSRYGTLPPPRLDPTGAAVTAGPAAATAWIVDLARWLGP